MDIKDSYRLKNFETYCIATIEVDRIIRLRFGAIAENRIKLALDIVRQKIEEEICSETDVDMKDAKYIIFNRHLEHYGKVLREQWFE